jgi:hypothetical protein
MLRLACVIGVVVGLAVSAVSTYRPQAQPVTSYRPPVQYARWGSLPGYPASGGYCLDVPPAR